MYAAELRLPPDTTKADREQVVNEVLDLCGTVRLARTRYVTLAEGGSAAVPADAHIASLAELPITIERWSRTVRVAGPTIGP